MVITDHRSVTRYRKDVLDIDKKSAYFLEA